MKPAPGHSQFVQYVLGWSAGALHSLRIGDHAVPLLLLISFPLLMVLVALMFGLSSHYDFDGNTRTLWFRISIFSLSYRIRYASFSDISAFATSGIRNRARIHTWWTYKVVMLLKSGRMISISGARDKSVYAMNRLSEKLAGAVGCQFFNSELRTGCPRLWWPAIARSWNSTTGQPPIITPSSGPILLCRCCFLPRLWLLSSVWRFRSADRFLL